MKKRFLHIAAAGLMALLLCALSLPVFSYEQAYTLYLKPDLSQTEGVFSTYVINFNTPSSGHATSWGLACFYPHISEETAALYPNLQQSGSWIACRVLYTDPGSRSAGLSTYSSSYTAGDQTQWITPKQLYPIHSFGDDGSVFNEDYPFEDDHWYTMVLHTWEEPSLDTTLLGQWLFDHETEKWTLINCVNTGYVQLGLGGPMTFFMENYSSTKKDSERSFKIGGIYARNKSDGVWNSINTASIYGDSLSTVTPVGNYEFGAEDSYFWGKTNGTKLENQEEFDSTRPAEQSFTIQPEHPSFGELIVGDLTLEQNYYNHWSVSWNISESSTPAVSYRIEVFDEEGARITEQSGALPYEHQGQFYLADYEGAFTCALTLTDPFGRSVTTQTQGFADQNGPDPSPSANEESGITKEEPASPSSDEERGNSPSPESAPTPSPALPSHPESDDPQSPQNARKLGLLVAALFFAAGILAALGGALGMIRQERSTSRTDDG